ncbi:MAG TPA: OsmC family protein [Chloroflexota bacterium]|nr:OsmC family protein [Chloroflexota bacterium]
MSDVAVTWVQGEQFVASGSGGHSIVLDGPGGRATWEGFKPSDLLLAALGGCTAMDVIAILRKKRQRVSGLRVTVRGEQREEYPRAFERIAVHFEVRGQDIVEAAVERAIALSEEKYCSVAATLRGVATITRSFTIVEEGSARAATERVTVAIG